MLRIKDKDLRWRLDRLLIPTKKGSKETRAKRGYDDWFLLLEHFWSHHAVDIFSVWMSHDIDINRVMIKICFLRWPARDLNWYHDVKFLMHYRTWINNSSLFIRQVCASQFLLYHCVHFFLNLLKVYRTYYIYRPTVIKSK